MINELEYYDGYFIATINGKIYHIDPKDLSRDFITTGLRSEVSDTTGDIYYIKNNDKLETIISSSPTDYVLYIPSTPRYYISASKRKLHRSSIKKIYFDNEENLNIAYVLLNSAYFYWWWRVVDGGMTLSLSLIHI